MPQDARVSYQFRAWTVILFAMLVIVPVAALIVPSGEGVGDDNSSSPPTRSWLDIAIGDIEVKRPTQSNNLYPGQKVRIDVHLVHDDYPYPSDIPISRGNSNQFTTVLVIDDGYDNVTTQYKQVTSMSINYTGADRPGYGANFPPYIVSFFWAVPARAPSASGGWSNFQFTVSSTITVDDDDKSDNYKGGSGVRISQPEFSPFVWEEGQDERDFESPDPHWVNVGDTKFIPFQLQNRGPAVDVIGIEVISSPEGWNIEGFSPRTVYPNDFEELQLPVQIAMNPFNAKSDEEYRVVVKAYSTLYAGPYLEQSEHTFRFKVRFLAKAEMIPETESVYLIPGEAHQVIFWLRNTGNGEDDYTLTAKVDDLHVRKGWKVAFESGTRQPTVKPDQYFKVITRVNVPVEASRFYNVNLVISIRSMTADYTSLSEPCTLFADIRFAAKIEEFDDPFPVEPGKENALAFNFTNDGNDKDKFQRLVVSYKPKGWWVFIDQTPLKQSNGIGPHTMVNLNMIVFVEETTVASSKGSLPFIVIQARGGPNDYLLDEERYYFRIPLKHKLEITAPAREKVGFVGGQIEFLINVRNQGNWLDTFNLSVDSEWADFDIDLSQEEIAPNETYPVKLIVEIPFEAAADTNPDTPLPDLRGFYDGYRIRVSGYSQNESKEGETITWVDLEVHVQPFYNFEMLINPGEPELKFSMDHDQARAVKVKIMNTGNIADTLKLDWVDNPYQEWLRLQNTYVDLSFGESAFAILNINPRAYTIIEEGNLSIELKAISQLDPDRMNPLTVTLNITIRFYRMMFEIQPPKVNGEPVSGVASLDYDRMYSFQVNIENIGSEELNPTRFETLYIVLYDSGFEMDRANITYLRSLGVKEVIFTWKATPPGTHDFSVALEGDLPISEEGVKEIDFAVYVPPPDRNPTPPDTQVPLWMILLPLILIVVFAAAAFVFITKFNQIMISPIDTGYDESGEYRPWAVKEKLKGDEPEQLGMPEERPALPPPSKPALPAGPQGRPQPSQAPPVPAQVRSGPVPSQAPRPMAQARPMQPPAPARPPVSQARPMQPPAPVRPPVPQARPPVPQQRPPAPAQQPPRPPVPQSGPQARPPVPQQRPPAPAQQPPRPPVPQSGPQAPPQQPPRPPVPNQPPAPPVPKPVQKPPQP